jgi:hypothetical protein
MTQGRHVVMRDALYDNQVFKHGYNPNTQRDLSYPEKPFEASARHMEESISAVPYLECCERQELGQWESYQHMLRTVQRKEDKSYVPPTNEPEGEEGEESPPPPEVPPAVGVLVFRPLAEWR